MQVLFSQKCWDVPQFWGFCTLNLFSISIVSGKYIVFPKLLILCIPLKPAPEPSGQEHQNLTFSPPHSKNGVVVYSKWGWPPMLKNRQGPSQSNIDKHFLDCGYWTVQYRLYTYFCQRQGPCWVETAAWRFFIIPWIGQRLYHFVYGRASWI